MFINHLFSPFSISTSAVSLSLARPFMALLLKACLRVLSLRHYKTVQNHPFIVKMNPSPFFVLLNCNCSLGSENSVYLQGVPRNMTFNKSLFLVKHPFASLSFTLKSI